MKIVVIRFYHRAGLFMEVNMDWEIYNTGGLNGDRYQIGRQKNADEPMHGGNVEWHGGVFHSKDAAQEVLSKLTAERDGCAI
jgi:hypothetical protein